MGVWVWGTILNQTPSSWHPHQLQQSAPPLRMLKFHAALTIQTSRRNDWSSVASGRQSSRRHHKKGHICFGRRSVRETCHIAKTKIKGRGGKTFRDEPELQPAWPPLLCRAASSANACGPVNTEQSYRHRGTATETRRTRALCTASHLCLKIGPIGPMGGIRIRGESGPGGL